MNNTFLYLVKQFADFTEDELSLVSKHFEPRKFRKKTILLEAGTTAIDVYFLLKGCIRLYYVKNGDDISAYFFTENMFAGAYDSFTSQKPSRHFMETLEDCEVLALSHNSLKELFIQVPGMNELVRKVLEERFVSLHELFTSQILDSPQERYIKLLEERPDLITRIPQHQIATFLGVTPVSLSRIRNRVAKR